LFILLFNIIGYRAWFYYAERKSDAILEARLDKDQFEENDLITLTIPLYNPYQADDNSFARADGEITFEGKAYRFVKRKISEGNLILRCIPDNHKMLLKKAKSDYANSTNDLSNTGKNQRSGIQKSYNGSDYITHQANFQILNRTISAIRQNDICIALNTDPYISSPGKPPQSRA